MASDLETIMAAMQAMEGRLNERINTLETKLLTQSANNLEDCVNTIEAVGESIRGMITAEGIRLKTQRVSTQSRIEALTKRVDAIESREKRA